MENDADLERYSRQIRFPKIGASGQRKLLSSRVTLCGCGALGTAIANGLVRAGIGHLRIIDRDFIELNNLQRQTLFDEEDIARNLPKAIAATEKLRRINSTIEIDPVVTDLDPSNIEELCKNADIILDGTDNFETRFLINDFAVKSNRPWIFGACLGSEGQSMTILPVETPCLRCLMDAPPAPGTTETCESAGILSSASALIAAVEVAEAIKILTGCFAEVRRTLLVVDVWSGTFKQLSLRGLRESSSCPACVHGKLEWLDGQRGVHTTKLCGRNAVQIVPAQRGRLDWQGLQTRLATLATVESNRFLLRFRVEGYELSVFPDGRAIIKGTDDISTARTLYSRYLGG